MDRKFEVLNNKVDAPINTTGADDHVPAIERFIRVVKERFRSERCTLPYTKIPPTVIKELVKFCNMWLNSFIIKGGVSNTLSPRCLLTGRSLDYNLHCKIPFGAYAHVNQYSTPRNSDKPRTVATICLGPTGNAQGTYKFLSLRTGKTLY